jgi:hypothetical protein
MTNPLLIGRQSDACAHTRIRIVITAFIVRNDRARVKYGTEQATQQALRRQHSAGRNNLGSVDQLHYAGNALTAVDAKLFVVERRMRTVHGHYAVVSFDSQSRRLGKPIGEEAPNASL